MITVSRYHDFSCGHRVVGHEGACAHLHGHNYRAHFNCRLHKDSELDQLGRVVDFSVIKSTLCQWLEDNWDHRMLMWAEDPWFNKLRKIDDYVVGLPFNPTAENMALFLLNHVGPIILENTDVELYLVTLEETRKCSAIVTR